jgi:hypothetical protein
VEGPVRANDYDWYEVVPERPVIDNIAEELPTGWVAAADHDGTPWLQAAAPECPPLPVTLGQLLDLTAKARLACYGSQQLSLEAFVPPVDVDAIAGPCFDLPAAECALAPSWLMAASGTAVTPGDGPGPPRYLFVAIDPDGVADDLRTLDTVRLVGSFDHPAARGCRHWDPSTGADLSSRTEAVVGCRSRFVVSSQQLLDRPPDATPSPDPSVSVEINGMPMTGKFFFEPEGGHVDVEVALIVQDLEIADCSLIHVITPDDPGLEPSTEQLEPLGLQTVSLVDGEHDFRASCESSAGTLETHTSAIAADSQPELCRHFEFSEGPISVTTLQELSDGMVGTWEGCVETPWVPVYFVRIAFHADGTYTADAPERLDGSETFPFYWGGEDDSSSNRYTIDDLQDSLKGLGEIEIPWRGELRHIRLMGDQLEFHFFNGDYGPLVFRLFRTT